MLADTGSLDMLYAEHSSTMLRLRQEVSSPVYLPHKTLVPTPGTLPNEFGSCQTLLTRLEDPHQSSPKQGTDMDYNRRSRIDYSESRHPVKISYFFQNGRGVCETFLFKRGFQ